jgi:hypothetical protein
MTTLAPNFAVKESFLVLDSPKPSDKLNAMLHRQWRRLKRGRSDANKSQHTMSGLFFSELDKHTHNSINGAGTHQERHGTSYARLAEPHRQNMIGAIPRPMSVDPMPTQYGMHTTPASTMPAPLPRQAPRPATTRTPKKLGIFIPPANMPTGLSAPMAPTSSGMMVKTPTNRIGRLSHHLHDLYTDESEYIGVLETLRDEFEVPLRAQFLSRKILKKVSSTDRPLSYLARNGSIGKQKPVAIVLDMLFRHISSLISIHQRLRDDVVEIKHMRGIEDINAYTTSCIAMFLGKRLTELGIYIEFVKQQLYALRAFENLYYIDEKFREAVLECEHKSGYHLRELLTKTRGRIWYYIGFVQEIMNISTNQPQGKIVHFEPNSHMPGYAGVRACLQYLKSLYCSIEPWLQKIDSIAELAKLQHQIADLTEPMVELHVKRLYEGDVYYHATFKAAGQPVRCWLFNDRIICARKVGVNAFEHVATMMLDRHSFVLAHMDQNGQQARTIGCRQDKREFFIHVDTDHQFEAWWNAIRYAQDIYANRTTE